jgi:hypothetical protein
MEMMLRSKYLYGCGYWGYDGAPASAPPNPGAAFDSAWASDHVLNVSYVFERIGLGRQEDNGLDTFNALIIG